MGFKIDAASIAPSAAPAPTRVWISSINRTMSPLVFISFKTFLSLSSKSPLYLEPATRADRSSVYICFPSRVTGTSPEIIF